MVQNWEMEPVRKPPRLQKRRHKFYCRIAVPVKLRPIIGKHEIIKPLNTGDYAEALRTLPMMSAEVGVAPRGRTTRAARCAILDTRK